MSGELLHQVTAKVHFLRGENLKLVSVDEGYGYVSFELTPGDLYGRFIRIFDHRPETLAAALPLKGYEEKDERTSLNRLLFAAVNKPAAVQVMRKGMFPYLNLYPTWLTKPKCLLSDPTFKLTGAARVEIEGSGIWSISFETLPDYRRRQVWLVLTDDLNAVIFHLYRRIPHGDEVEKGTVTVNSRPGQFQEKELAPVSS